MIIATELRERTGRIDEIVRGAWREASGDDWGGYLLVAVGGYGRGEQYPYSDVDLLVVSPDGELGPVEQQGMGLFQRILWDAGLRISHQVRTVADCCRWRADHLETAVSLLDERLLAGDLERYEGFQAALSGFFRRNEGRIRTALMERSRGRHRKFDDTIYHLEPDVKDGPGGLRDAQTIGWLNRLGATASEPGEVGVLVRVRWALHEGEGRDRNVLTFEQQERIYGLDAGKALGMRDYFRCARRVHHALLRQLEQSEPTSLNLMVGVQALSRRIAGREFAEVGGRLYLRDAKGLTLERILRLFGLSGKHGARLAADTEEVLLRWEGQTFATVWSTWRELLGGEWTGRALRGMHESGFLARLLPEWERVDCLVIPDYFHRFTVDEHTIRAVETFDGLLDSEDSRFVAVRRDLGRPELLRLALLLHDLGKGSGEEHTRAGRRIAAEILRRWEVPEEDGRVVEFLVEHHLLLSQLATTRDLDDERDMLGVAETIGTVERLKLLLVMTYCDISAVNPQAMKAWRRDQIWRAYSVVERLLTRGGDRVEVNEAVVLATHFPAHFPARYERTHTPAEMAHDEDLVREAERAGVATTCEQTPGGLRLSVVVEDRTGLLADLAGAMAAFGLNVFRAEAFTGQFGERRWAVDRFFCEDPFKTVELNPAEGTRLQELVQRAARGELDVAEELKRRRVVRKRGAGTPPQVRFDESVAGRTLLEVVADDRPGLLYDVTRTMDEAGCELDLVLIDTRAHRAMDVFYCTKQGRKLSEDEVSDLRARLLSVLT